MIEPAIDAPAAQEKDQSVTITVASYEDAVRHIDRLKPTANGELATLLNALHSFFSSRIEKSSSPRMDKEEDRDAAVSARAKSRQSWRAPRSEPTAVPNAGEEYGSSLLGRK